MFLCMCVSVGVLSLLRCPNEWPHSGEGSSQITEQNGRPPAAWVANKCHHNIHRGEEGTEGTDSGRKVDERGMQENPQLQVAGSSGRE